MSEDDREVEGMVRGGEGGIRINKGHQVLVERFVEGVTSKNFQQQIEVFASKPVGADQTMVLEDQFLDTTFESFGNLLTAVRQQVLNDLSSRQANLTSLARKVKDGSLNANGLSDIVNKVGMQHAEKEDEITEPPLSTLVDRTVKGAAFLYKLQNNYGLPSEDLDRGVSNVRAGISELSIELEGKGIEIELIKPLKVSIAELNRYRKLG